MKSISNRLKVGLSLIIVFFIVQLALVWWQEINLKRELLKTIQKNTVASSQLSELAVLAQQIRRYEKEYFVYVGNKDRRDAYEKEWGDASLKINKLLNNIQTESKPFYDDADTVNVTAWVSAADFYAAEMRKIFSKTEINSAALESFKLTTLAPTTTKPIPANSKPEVPNALSSAEVNSMITDGKTRFSGVLIKGVSEMSAIKNKQTLSLTQVTGKSLDNQLIIILSTIILGLLISLVLLVTLPRSITLPLKTLTQSVDNISKGNLDKKITSVAFIEFQGLREAIERMQIAQKILISRMRS